MQIVRSLTILKIVILTYLIGIFACPPIFCQNEEPQFADTQRLLYHENILNSYNLPAPGDLIEIRVQLLNTKDITVPLFGLFTHDDRLMVVQAEKIFLNQFDNVEYTFHTFAPIAKLQYQFFSKQEDETAIISPIYNVERDCRYPIATYKIDLPNTLQGLERVSKVIDTTLGLERDIKAYDQALSLIGKIKEELNLIKQR